MVVLLYVHLEQHEESMSGGSERRNEVLNHKTCAVAFPAWYAKTPSAISIESLFEFFVAFAPACSGSLQLGVAMSHAMGTS